MDDDTPDKCLICGGPLSRKRPVRVGTWGDGSVDLDQGEWCPNGCVDTVEYTDAKNKWRAERAGSTSGA